MWCKLLCSSRSSLRADRLVEKSAGSDINWFQLRSSFSRKDKEKNAWEKRDREKDREKRTFELIPFCFSFTLAQTNSFDPPFPPLLLPVQHCDPDGPQAFILTFLPPFIIPHLFQLLSIPSVQLLLMLSSTGISTECTLTLEQVFPLQLKVTTTAFLAYTSTDISTFLLQLTFPVHPSLMSWHFNCFHLTYHFNCSLCLEFN